MRLYTNVFYKLGIDFAVVNSLDSYDEISLTDEFKVMTRNYERIYRPQALGFSAVRPEELSGGDCKEDAARIFDNVLTTAPEARPNAMCHRKRRLRHPSYGTGKGD